MRTAVARLGNALLWLEIAETPEEQALGLQGRQGLHEHHGMYFPNRSPSPVTFQMRSVAFPIDMVFFRNHHVTRIVRSIPPGHPDRWSCDDCSGVLELAGGWAERHGLRLGTPLQF